MNSDSVITNEGIKVSESMRKVLYLTSKRLFDIVVGLVGVILLIPLAFVVKLISLYEGDIDSIFYKQKRIGKNGKLFTMYKFRTMVSDAEEKLVQLMKTNPNFRNEYMENKKVKNDPRITKVGRFLRHTSLDEIPQFINVLKGDMSLVGNRPYIPLEKLDMGTYYKDIVKTKPGITGLWQTSGRSKTTFEERLKIEKRYSNNHGFKIDIKIIIDTILQFIKKDNDGAI